MQEHMLRNLLTTRSHAAATIAGMDKVEKIHASKQPNRPHYIKEWADRYSLNQSALAAEIGADKSLVSRWYKGTSPTLEYQQKLAALFDIEREELFRHPDENWLTRKLRGHQGLSKFLQERTDADLDQLERIIKATFPDKKDGTNG